MYPARWFMVENLDQIPKGWQAKCLDLRGEKESTTEVDR
jgi:hypothetical protein